MKKLLSIVIISAISCAVAVGSEQSNLDDANLDEARGAYAERMSSPITATVITTPDQPEQLGKDMPKDKKVQQRKLTLNRLEKRLTKAGDAQEKKQIQNRITELKGRFEQKSVSKKDRKVSVKNKK